MIHCNSAKQDFSAYWEEELSPARRSELEAHWQGCASCRAEYDAFVTVVRATRAMAHLEAPSDFAARVLARVHDIESSRPAFGWGLGRLFDARTWRTDWGFRPALAAAAAVVVLVVAVAVVNRGELPTPGSNRSVDQVALTEPQTDLPTDLPDASRERASAPTSPDAAAGKAEARMDAVAQSAPAPSATRAATRGTAVESLSGEDALPQEVATLPAPSGTPSILDSLFRQELDVEFALDRVRLRRVPGDSTLTPMPAMPGAPEGKPASLTF